MSRLLKSCPFIFILSILLLPGCTKNKPIDEDKFARIYADLLIAQDTVSGNNMLSAKEKIFKHYGVNEKNYKNTVDYYNSDPQKWEKVFDKASDYVETLRNRNQPPPRTK